MYFTVDAMEYMTNFSINFLASDQETEIEHMKKKVKSIFFSMSLAECRKNIFEKRTSLEASLILVRRRSLPQRHSVSYSNFYFLFVLL